MKNVTQIDPHTHRLTVPYKDIYTTVYLMQGQDGFILFDTASFSEDVDTYVLPMLRQLGVDQDQLKYIFISHSHKDHDGGLADLLQVFPGVKILSRNARMAERFAEHTVICPKDGDTFLGVFQTVPLPGHSIDSCALLDTRTATLFTGDSMQMYGIFGSEDWGANIRYPAEYLPALQRAQQLQIHRIFTAHDFHPYGYKAENATEVQRFFDACVAPLERLRQLITQNPDADDQTIRQMYNEADVPPIGAHVAAALRQMLLAEK